MVTRPTIVATLVVLLLLMLLLLHPQHRLLLLLLLLLLGVGLLVVLLLLLLLDKQLLDDEVGILAELLLGRHLPLSLLLVELRLLLLLLVKISTLQRVISWVFLRRLVRVGIHVWVENGGIHLQTSVRLGQIPAHGLEVRHEAMGLLICIAVDLMVELVAD